MIGKVVGALIGGAIGKERKKRPVAGAIIGAGTMFAARRLFPQRYAFIAASAAAAYLTKKWAESAEASAAAKAARGGDGDAVISAAPTDGASMGDALPPAIPLDGDGNIMVVH